jgi:hypothetical protein
MLVPVGLTVVALGFLRGTLFGRVHALDSVFGTAYGITWLIALLSSVGVIFWALLVLAPRAEALNTAKSPEAYGGDREPAEGLDARRDRRLRRHLHLHDPHALRLSSRPASDPAATLPRILEGG